MRILPLSLMLLAMGCGNNSVREVQRQVTKVVPALGKVSEAASYEEVQCDQVINTSPARGCTIQTITCGSVVEGNTQFGEKRFGDQFYVSAFCTPYRHFYEDAPEAVYRLEMPPNVQADVRLDSDCADLDVFSMSWSDTRSCPTEANVGRIRECEMDTHEGGGKIRMTTVDNPQIYVVGVDGKNGATGNFRLTVVCSTYR